MPEFCIDLAALEGGGRRERRVLVAPIARLQRKKQAAVTTGTPKQSGAPCAMVYGLFRAPRSAGLDSLRRLSMMIGRLDPASGDRDHAALLVRESIARLAIFPRPSHPVPTFVAIGQTPLQVEAGRADQSIYFRKTEDG